MTLTRLRRKHGGMSAPQLTPHDERRIAVLAGVDPRTVRAYLTGRRLRSTCHARVEDALRQVGRVELVRPPLPQPRGRAA